jgi:hydrogenase expression/formation protein HypE
MDAKHILLDYGSGGKASQRLISELFLRHFDNPVLARMDDAAFLDIQGPLAMSTDSFVVGPVFFPGATTLAGRARHGERRAMLGARPFYLSCAFILEEGFEL